MNEVDFLNLDDGSVLDDDGGINIPSDDDNMNGLGESVANDIDDREDEVYAELDEDDDDY